MSTRALIIDDSMLARRMVKTFLDSLAAGDWSYIEAGNAEDAEVRLREEQPDVVFLDVNMPGESGLDFIQRLRPEFPETKICLVTANAQSSTRAIAEKLGLHLLPKPATEEKFRTLLDQLGMSA